MTKEKALYQAKLILDNLPKDEYALLPQEEIQYILENMEYDENITINPDIPLEAQDIDDATVSILEKILNKVDKTKISTQTKVEAEDDINIIKLENIRLAKLLEDAKKENDKIPKIRELVEDYKKALKAKDDEIADLKQQNEQLYSSIKNTPKLFRKIFFKQFEQKMLK